MQYSARIIEVVSLGILLVGFTGYNFMFADAPANPPANNVAAPLNVSATPQTKAAGLDLASLTVQGGSIFSGTPSISNTAPTLKFEDTTASARDFWLRTDGNFMYFLADRNDDGAWGGENPWPLALSAGATAADDYAVFSNQVRSPQYCDTNGGNCFTAANVRGATCRVEAVSALGVYSSQSRITATCDSDEVVTGGGCNTTATANSLQDFPSGNGWQCYKHTGENTGNEHRVYAMCCKK